MTALTPSLSLGLVAKQINNSRIHLKRLAKDYYLGIAQALERKRYGNLWRKQLTVEQGNSKIYDLLLSRRPFLVGRIGHTEGRIVGESIFQQKKYGATTVKQAHQNAGIFPVSSDVLSKFAEIYAASVGQADLLGFWQTTYQARLLTECYPYIPLAPLPALEPYLYASPWSAALKGRRVLVVHPFVGSISHQFRVNRLALFPHHDVLPEFDLQLLAPPQTLAPMTGGYATWLDALHHLTESVLNRDFDVALLGCGAYGLPLGAAIKSAGKQAIHLGGALQVLFGIRGRRWENDSAIARLMNDNWIRPSQEETPVSASLVDEGCYW